MQYNGRMRRGVDLKACTQSNGIDMQSMPYVMRIILENQLRSQLFGKPITHQEILQTLQWQDHVGSDLSLFVTRVILPDSSGIPVLQDLAALRNAVAREGGNPSSVDTCIPVDLVVDHSLQVDAWGTPDAMKMNMRHEFDRNAERYAFLGWAQQAFSGLNVFPPGSGIIHQVNLERIATVVASSTHNNHEWMFPEFIIGGDSHTPMINALGVLGWGVGGIE
ncbi:MAG: aconitate hydratase, partial [Betaproteobacteria bacterium]|nr:aconitate hydratase [Betaproteobacteria bacterium]